ncbi:unnamed protein product [Sympodiomycopsis kandeliae]
MPRPSTKGKGRDIDTIAGEIRQSSQRDSARRSSLTKSPFAQSQFRISPTNSRDNDGSNNRWPDVPSSTAESTPYRSAMSHGSSNRYPAQIGGSLAASHAPASTFYSTRGSGKLDFTHEPPPSSSSHKRRRLSRTQYGDDENDRPQHRNASGTTSSHRRPATSRGAGASSKSAISIEDSDHDDSQASGPDDDDEPQKVSQRRSPSPLSSSPLAHRLPRSGAGQRQSRPSSPTSLPSPPPTPQQRPASRLAVETDEEDTIRKSLSSAKTAYVSSRKPPPYEYEGDSSSIDPIDLLADGLSEPDEDRRQPILPRTSGLATSTARQTKASKMAGKDPSSRQLGKEVDGSLWKSQAQSRSTIASNDEATHSSPNRQSPDQRPAKAQTLQLEFLLIGEHVVSNGGPTADFTAQGEDILLAWRGQNGVNRYSIESSDITHAILKSRDHQDPRLLILQLNPAFRLGKRLDEDFDGEFDSRSSGRNTLAFKSTGVSKHDQVVWVAFCSWFRSFLRTGSVDHIDSAGARAIYDSDIKPKIAAWTQKAAHKQQYLEKKQKERLSMSPVETIRSNGLRSGKASDLASKDSTAIASKKSNLFRPTDPASRRGPIQLEGSDDKASKSSTAQQQQALGRPRPRPTATASSSNAATEALTSDSFYNNNASARSTRRSVAEGRAVLHLPEKSNGSDRRKDRDRDLLGSPPPAPPTRSKRTKDSLLFGYPFERPGAVSVFESDCDRLQEGEFLNDTIIEFGLKYHLEQIRLRDEALFASMYVYNSFFYRQLTKSRNKPDEMYKQVRKWTAKIDIFAKDFLIIPINENLHWYLAVVLNPGKALEQVVSEEEEMEDVEIKAGGEDVAQNDAKQADRPASLKDDSEGLDTPPPRPSGRELDQGKLATAEEPRPQQELVEDEKEAGSALVGATTREDDHQQDQEVHPDNPVQSTSSSGDKVEDVHVAEEGGSSAQSSRDGTNAAESPVKDAQSSRDASELLQEAMGDDDQMVSGAIAEETRSAHQAVADVEMTDSKPVSEASSIPTSFTKLREWIPSPFSSTDVDMTRGEEGRPGSPVGDEGDANIGEPASGENVPSPPVDSEAVTDNSSNIHNAGRGTLIGGGPSSSSPDTSSKKPAMRIVPGDSMAKWERTNGSGSPEQPASRPRPKPVRPQAQYGSRQRTASSGSRMQHGNFPGVGMSLDGRNDGESGSRSVSASGARNSRRASGRHSTPLSLSPEPQSRKEAPKESGPGLNLPFSPPSSPGPAITATSSKKASRSPSPVKNKSPTREDHRASPLISDRKAQSMATYRAMLQEFCVITFDSLGGSHSSVRTQLMHYLRNEANDKKGLTINPKANYLQVSVPEQKNFCDCGLFVLLYFERFFGDVTAFLNRIIPEKDSKNESWKAESAKTARQHWRNLIADLGEQWKEKEKRKAEEKAAATKSEGQEDGVDAAEKQSADKKEGVESGSGDDKSSDAADKVKGTNSGSATKDQTDVDDGDEFEIVTPKSIK